MANRASTTSPPARATPTSAASFPTQRLTNSGGVAGLLASEWLITNGLGGFAMGTAAGVPTRRYHGLLIAATRPPVGRVMALNTTADQLIVDPDSPKALPIDLSGFHFAGLGDTVHPDGPTRIESFTKDQSVTWVYATPVARVIKTVHLHRGTNAVSLAYSVERAEANSKVPLRLTVRPLVSLRDFHSLIRRAWADRFSIRDLQPRGLTIERDGQSMVLRSDAAAFRPDPQWWHDFLYTEEAARGQDCVEDLFSPGAFSVDLPPGQSRSEFIIRAAIGDVTDPSRQDLDKDRTVRADRAATLAKRASSTLGASATSAIRQTLAVLVAASDEFVVARSDGTAARPAVQGHGAGVSIIAGYPWFSDWGRDTFISLPGLMLTTGRLDEAKETLRVFAAHRKRGLIPNVFNEHTGEPEYNTVDAPLWFMHAACAYVESGGDKSFFKTDLAPACLDVIANFRRGTEHNIAMDPFDKLITAGTGATQLTWMDARRDGVVFTPRYGKAVEINALWISGLKRLAALLSGDDTHTAANLNDLADAAAKSFRKSFWNEGAGIGGCCFDCLTPSDSDAGPIVWRPDAAVRPNQIFAVSLPHSPLAPEQQRAVLRTVKERLWTPRGLRTLDPADSRYKGRYQGTLFERDSAYHNGTAWPWLLGPLAEATMRLDGFSESSRSEARAILAPMLETLTGATPERSGCLGQIAEIYDGDDPQRLQGCLAQAWSVGELLRVLTLAEAH